MKPTISIVIALAPGRSAEVLDSLAHVHYPKEKYEVIIKEGTNPSANRNNGVKEARGEIIALIDDDAYVHPELLTRAEQFFTQHKNISIVGGPQLTPKNDNLFAQATGAIIASPFGAAHMSKRYKQSRLTLNANEDMLTSANCFIRKKAYIDIGGFNTKLFPGEDPEFFARAKQRGYVIAYTPKLIVYHKRRATYGAFLKQFFNYGYTRLTKESYTKAKLHWFYYTPLLFSVYIIPLIALSFLHWIFLIPLALYAFFALLFSAYETGRHRNVALIILGPILYFSMHAAYGIGMLTSLFRPPKARI